MFFNYALFLVMFNLCLGILTDAEFFEEASFKYTMFPEGAMISESHFYEEVDFKCTEYSGEVIIEGA